MEAVADPKEGWQVADGVRPRVLWLIKGLGPGGAEQLLVSAARVRDRSSFDVTTAYLLPWKDHLAPALEAQGIPTACLGVRHPADPRWVRRLRRHLRDHPVELVHVHSPLVAGAARLAIRTLPRGRRPRLVTTEHNRWSSYTRPTRWLNAATFALGDAWLAVSPDVRDSVHPRFRDRVEVVVHGMPLADVQAQRQHREAVRAELGVGPAEVAVCTVANFRREKAYRDLLQAARRVVDERPDVRFFAVGQGPLEAEIRRWHAELGLGDRFVLLGYRPDAVRVVAGCDVFALSSIHEGYPISVMEALAVGVPVVATRVGGVPEAVRDGVEGQIVPPRRPDLLAEAILHLIRDPERRRRMAGAAAERGERFDITAAVRRIEDVYREVLA